MADTPSTGSGWKIVFFDSETQTEYDDYFKRYPRQAHVKRQFECDVKNNPFFHPVLHRIEKLKGQFGGLFRYSKSETRVIYQPDGESKTVYPIKTEKGPDASYKKRNKRKQF